MNGDMYSFDFSDRDILAADFVSALVDVRKSSKPSKTGVASKGKLAEIVSEDIPDINTEAKVSAKNVMCDYGQETLYVVGTDGSSMIMLRSEGDWEQKLQDNTAKALCSYFDREILKMQVQFALERLFDSVFGGVGYPDTLFRLSDISITVSTAGAGAPAVFSLCAKAQPTLTQKSPAHRNVRGIGLCS